MVRFIVKGVKEILVLDEIMYKNTEEFFKDLALGMISGEIIVNWAEGIVFFHQALPWNEITSKEYIENDRLYWSFVRYAPMKEYKDRIVEGNVIFRINKTRAPILIEVAKELKKRLGLEE